jgi:cell division protease FtsH
VINIPPSVACLVKKEHPHQSMFFAENCARSKTCSETRVTQIDGEISRLMDEAHERVRNILSERRRILGYLAHLLSQKEIVQGEELRKMLSEAAAGMAAASPVRQSVE